MTNDEPQQVPEAQTSRFRWDIGDTGDGISLPADRQAQLIRWQYEYQKDVASNKTPRPAGPFAGRVLTGAEVYWLAASLLAADVKVGNPGATSEHRMQEAFGRLRATKTEPLLRVSLDFTKLNLNGAILSGADLAGAVLGKAQLVGAVMGVTHLEGAYLGGAVLRDAFLDRANLTKATLAGAQLQGASMREADLSKAELGSANLDDAILSYGNLTNARLIGAHLHDVDLRGAQLKDANFINADLSGAFLYESHVEGTFFTNARLTGCDLRRTIFTADSRLNDAKLEHASLEQAFLQDTNLAVVEWKDVSKLSDEIEAREAKKRTYHYEQREHEISERSKNGARRTYTYMSATRIRGFREYRKTRQQRVDDYRAAERAYRALSARLNEQGVARDAARFQYRAEVMARNANFHRGGIFYLSALGSFLLGWFSGYGIYNIWRLLLTYVGVIAGFTAFYVVYGVVNGQPLTWSSLFSALLLSITTLHGRGFGQLTTQNSLLFSGVATFESVVGVGVEALVVAALVRRITGD